MTVHLPLASHAGVFGGARLSSLVGRDERRAPLKTPAWEANLPRDSVKFCVIFKDCVWATWGSDMKIVIEFPRKVFYSSQKSGNLATKAQKTIKKKQKQKKKKTTLDNLPRLFTVPHFFVRSFRYTASYRHRYLDFQIYRGGGRRVL